MWETHDALLDNSAHLWIMWTTTQQTGETPTMTTVTVNAEALRQVLSALVGPAHYVIELQVMADMPDIMKETPDPISLLVKEFNEQMKEIT